MDGPIVKYLVPTIWLVLFFQPIPTSCSMCVVLTVSVSLYEGIRSIQFHRKKYDHTNSENCVSCSKILLLQERNHQKVKEIVDSFELLRNFGILADMLHLFDNLTDNYGLRDELIKITWINVLLT